MYPDSISLLLAGSRGNEIASTYLAARKNSVYPIYWFLAKRNFARKEAR
ncbi:hypothetical protein ACI2OX_19780 [Bacillus sp. N9]